MGSSKLLTWRSSLTKRVWFKLNCKTLISVVTSIGETDAARIFDSIGQGSFGAALASSLNIGTAIYDATEGETCY